MEVPKKFEAKDLQPRRDDEPNSNGRYKSDKTPRDMEALQAYLAAFPFEWKVRYVHDEPCGAPGYGGKAQMRVQGLLEGKGVKIGTFEVTFEGRRIEVSLPAERQAIFEKAVNHLALPEKKE